MSRTSFADLLREELWRRKLEAAGFKTSDVPFRAAAPT